ncbi:hypothetical protein [Mycolicibacterium iranicum]|uniref:Serine hydrolase n=1 Tax=Mycolicibacterium iranicum TaxID=912594 RepID=A0ABT4HM14_MYCIR|nr:hypothetical protein [Mycolicibacterium iranicum]MCZ0731251.1 hypothetical protein [Mycolicibacterium iranicum]
MTEKLQHPLVHSTTELTVTAVTPVDPIPDPPLGPSSERLADLSTSFEQLGNTLPAGEVGLVLFAGEGATQYGTWNSGAAWSTIKVPLSIAALRADQATAEPLIERAISLSDNAAADQLWGMLGSPAEAATAVDAVLREGHDAATVVEYQQRQAPYSAYGQTYWKGADLATFAFELPCVVGSLAVLEHMRNLGGNQQWGVAPFERVAAKGGWGPGPDGQYLVRQLALVENDDGTFGASLAAKPADGTFETGKAIVDALGSWLDLWRNAIPGGRC